MLPPKSSPAPDIREAKTAPADALSLDQLRTKRSAVEAMEGLDESVKKSPLWVSGPRHRLSSSGPDRARHEALLDKVRSAPDRIKKLQAQAKRPLPLLILPGFQPPWTLRCWNRKLIRRTQPGSCKNGFRKWETELEEERNSPQQIPVGDNPDQSSNCWKSAKNSSGPT